jgi:hypothetical protein
MQNQVTICNSVAHQGHAKAAEVEKASGYEIRS